MAAQRQLVNDEHYGSAFGCHPFVSALAGKVKQKLAPRGELLAAHKRPPCDSIMERLIRSPIPVPLGFVVKKTLNICSAWCGGSPTPVSLTDTITCPFFAGCELMISSRVVST